MCIVSMVHDFGQKLPEDIWKMPGALPAFDGIVKQASEFDRVTKQPDCFDPEKLKFLEKVKTEQGVVPMPAHAPDLTPEAYRAEIERLKEAHVLREKAFQEMLEIRAAANRAALTQVKSLEAALADATKRGIDLKQDLDGSQKDIQDLTADFDHLKIGYARMAVDAGHKVSVCGSGEFFTQVDIDLPTGPVRFFIDNVYAPLLAGLPYGISDFKGAYDRDTQDLRLTGAFHPDIDQSLIPEPMTPERVLAILEPVSPPFDLSNIRFGVPHNKASSL